MFDKKRRLLQTYAFEIGSYFLFWAHWLPPIGIGDSSCLLKAPKLIFQHLLFQTCMTFSQKCFIKKRLQNNPQWRPLYGHQPSRHFSEYFRFCSTDETYRLERWCEIFWHTVKEIFRCPIIEVLSAQIAPSSKHIWWFTLRSVGGLLFVFVGFQRPLILHADWVGQKPPVLCVCGFLWMCVGMSVFGWL